MLEFQIYQGFVYFFRILRYLILAYWILSLFRPNFRLYYMLENFLAPLLRPFRILNMKLMSKMRGGMMIDFSIWFALIALSIAESIVWRIFIALVN